VLKIIYGDVPESIYNTSVYFKNTYEPEWIVSDLAKKIILDIDKSEVIDSECIKSPVLGLIPPERLAGGTKTLLLVLNRPDMVFNASTCGDNCAKWLLTIGQLQDVTINLRHMMNFGVDVSFDICVKNNGQIVHSMKELFPIAHSLLKEMGQIQI
jgi:hypothetical protein